MTSLNKHSESLGVPFFKFFMGVHIVEYVFTFTVPQLFYFFITYKTKKSSLSFKGLILNFILPKFLWFDFLYLILESICYANF